MKHWDTTEYSARASMAPSHHRTNNIVHDDEAARKLGFKGGLITGTTVYGYASHLPAQNWGAAWLEGGACTLSLRGPTFEGDPLRITAGLTDSSTGTYEIVLRSSEAEPRMLMKAWLRPEPTTPAISIPLQPRNADTPRLTPQLLPGGGVLGSFEDALDERESLEYLEQIGEVAALYREDRLVHPGQMLHLANELLMHNFTLEPWYHVKTELEHFTLIHWGDRISVRARVVEAYQRNQNLLATVDYEWVLNDEVLAAKARHTLMYHRHMQR